MNEPPCQDCVRLRAEVERLTAQAGILMEKESVARAESAALREQLATQDAAAKYVIDDWRMELDMANAEIERVEKERDEARAKEGGK
jgi:regulator of replication initiation timing